MDAKFQVVGYEGPLSDINSVDIRVEGLGRKNKIEFISRFVLGEFQLFRLDNSSNTYILTGRETIEIPRRNNPFEARGKKIRILIKVNCETRKFDKHRIDGFLQLVLSSLALGKSMSYASKVVCGREDQPVHISSTVIKRNTFEVKVEFRAQVPENLLQKITELIIRFRNSTTAFPRYILTRLNRGKINGIPTVYATKKFLNMRKYYVFSPQLTVTSEFQCKGKSSQGSNLSTFDFTLSSFEFGKRYLYRVLGTCGIQRMAMFTKATPIALTDVS